MTLMYRHNIKNAPTVNIPITALHTVIIGGSLPPAIPKAKIQKVFTEIEVTADVITDKSTTMRLVYPGLNTPRYQTAIEYSNEERSFLVRGIFPETEKSAINVRLLLSKRNSIFRVRVNGENVSISSSEDLDRKEDGSYSVTVNLKNIKPNEPFKVILTHVKPQSEELESSTLSLNSIIALPY